MKIEFVNGVPNCDGSWNIRRVEHRGCIVSSNGTFAPAGTTDFEYKKDKIIVKERRTNHILIVKQPTLAKTALVLLHELCHWFVHKVFGRNLKAKKKWHKRIDDYL